MLLIGAVAEPDNAATVAASCWNYLSDTPIGGHEFFITVSVGISLYPADGMAPNLLIRLRGCGDVLTGQSPGPQQLSVLQARNRPPAS